MPLAKRRPDGLRRTTFRYKSRPGAAQQYELRGIGSAIENASQFSRHVIGHGVAIVGTVQGNSQNRSVLLNENVIAHWQSFPLCARPHERVVNGAGIL